VDYYSPAETVERTGFSLDTLRYYEKIGLLEGVARDAGGRRRYSEEDLSWLGLFRCLRDTGMPIAEMIRYVELARAGDHTLAARIALFEEHDRRVEEQIALLRRQQEKIQFKISLYREAAAAAEPAEPASV
jgi:DNA-binding transcriptional MerR regulator